MSKKIVIATHAGLAKGFQDCMKFLTGLGEDFTTICAFTDAPEPKEEIQRFFASVSREDKMCIRDRFHPFCPLYKVPPVHCPASARCIKGLPGESRKRPYPATPPLTVPEPLSPRCREKRPVYEPALFPLLYELPIPRRHIQHLSLIHI